MCRRDLRVSDLPPAESPDAENEFEDEEAGENQAGDVEAVADSVPGFGRVAFFTSVEVDDYAVSL
jgi:hypothetical protein